MIRDSEKFADDDKKRKDVVEAINHADGAIHSVERAMEEYKDQLNPEDVKKATEGIQNLRHAMESKDPAAIKNAVNDLQRASLKVFERAYSKGTNANTDGDKRDADSSSSESEPNIKDADFKDADKKN